MAYHVHYKNGKTAVWCSTSESYVTPWCSKKQEETIIEPFVDEAVEAGTRRAENLIKRAKKYKSCSNFGPPCKKI